MNKSFHLNLKSNGLFWKYLDFCIFEESRNLKICDVNTVTSTQTFLKEMFSIFHRLITDIQKTKKGQAQEIWLLINCDPGWAIDSHQLWDFPNIS